MDVFDAGIAAFGEGAQQIERRRRLAIGLDLTARIGAARCFGEGNVVDDVAAIARQLLAVALFARRSFRRNRRLAAGKPHPLQRAQAPSSGCAPRRQTPMAETSQVAFRCRPEPAGPDSPGPAGLASCASYRASNARASRMAPNLPGLYTRAPGRGQIAEKMP